MPQAERLSSDHPRSDSLEDALEKAAELLEIPATSLIEFVRQNIEELFEGADVLNAQAELGMEEGDYRSANLNMTLQNGKKAPVEASCAFDVHYYRGYIKELDCPGGAEDLCPMANVKLVKWVMPKDNRVPRLKELAKTDMRAC